MKYYFIMNHMKIIVFHFEVLRMERVEIRNIRSMAKVFGTIICVAGAVSIALFKGPMLMINQNSGTIISMFLASGDEWKLGCLCFLLSTSCWALWIILQVYVKGIKCKNIKQITFFPKKLKILIFLIFLFS